MRLRDYYSSFYGLDEGFATGLATNGHSTQKDGFPLFCRILWTILQFVLNISVMQCIHLKLYLNNALFGLEIDSVRFMKNFRFLQPNKIIA